MYVSRALFQQNASKVSSKGEKAHYIRNGKMIRNPTPKERYFLLQSNQPSPPMPGLLPKSLPPPPMDTHTQTHLPIHLCAVDSFNQPEK